MPEPGWYPDPGGAPGQFRFWNGSAWSSETSTSPGAAGSDNQGLVRLIGALVVVALLVGLVIWRVNSPTQFPAPSDVPFSSGDSPMACPTTQTEILGTVVAGRMESGDVSVPTIATWNEPDRTFSLNGLSGIVTQSKTITSGWQSDSVVGLASRSDFPSAKAAARTLARCLAESSVYKSVVSVTNLSDGAVTVAGHEAYRVRTEIKVAFRDPKIAGDETDVIVIDTGNPDTYGVYIATFTIGDTETQAELDTVIADIRVTS